ncbi:hypothetical protein [Brochothrix thermosphacta]|uniref:hypothetical protein n=1 Tax=Brochothrix thermosphacta TaxID=2756 RepID=UPI00159F349B|nr:hypothetical protein [Brochothrix thermosphacta]
MLNSTGDLLTIVGTIVATASFIVWLLIGKIDHILPRLLGVIKLRIIKLLK